MQHGISYRAKKKPKALCLRLRYFGFFFLSEKNFKRPMHTETKDPSLYLCTALSRISDTVNASHHHLRHRHDNLYKRFSTCSAFPFAVRGIKNCVYYSTFRKEAQPRFPDIFLPQLPPELSMRSVYSSGSPSMQASKFFQEGMIIPVRFVAGHRVDVDIVDAVENALFNIRIIAF